MTQHLGFTAAVLLTALVGALLEVQIEGGAGWASEMPTWRIRNRWTRALLGNRDLTGYHAFAHAFVLVALHVPFALGIAPFTWAGELRLLAFLVLFWIAEDFLWFVVNPSYGIRSFRHDVVWWHARTWWGIMPREYWLFTPIGIGLYALSLR